MLQTLGRSVQREQKLPFKAPVQHLLDQLKLILIAVILKPADRVILQICALLQQKVMLPEGRGNCDPCGKIASIPPEHRNRIET